MIFRMARSRESKHARGFTLIELLVVIAIIAILSVVVILTLNPAELLRQSRDSNRVADMGTLTTALGIFSEDQSSGFLGSANTVYVSIPDPTATSTLGDQCQGLGLPTLPSTYSYHCAASSTYRNINGNGWIPVNFSSISLGSPLGSLPIDPINQSSSRNYYTYTTNTTQYEVTSVMESQKYKLGGSNDVVGPDGSTLSTVYAKGSNLSLEPLDYGDSSLVGYWSLNEGTGTVAYDYSGNGNTGSWTGTATGTNGYYSPGKIGPWAGAFDGSSTYVTIPNNSNLNISNAITLSAWIYATKNSIVNPLDVISKSSITQNNGYIFPRTDDGWSHAIIYLNIGGGWSNWSTLSAPYGSAYLNQWHYLVATYDGSSMKVYVDGLLGASKSQSGSISTNTNALAIGVQPGYSEFFGGSVDDARVYNRALSASEIAAMYAGGK